MIIMRNKEDLQEILRYEFNLYFHSQRDYLKSFLLRQNRFYIWQLQKNLRRLEYLVCVGG